MLSSPECAQVWRISVVEGLDGPLDDGMAGGDHITLSVFAVDSLGKDMGLSRIGVDELTPEFGMRLRRFRVEGRCLFVGLVGE